MRERGTGSVFKDRGRWVAYMPSDMGRGYLGTFATEEEAAAELAVSIEEAAGGVTTVAEWGDDWLRARKKRREIASAHQDLTEWRRLVTGTPMGDLPLGEVEQADIRQWLANLRRQDGGKFVSTALSGYLSLVRKVLDAACDAGRLRQNPAMGLRLKRGAGKKPGRGKDLYSVAQVDELVEKALEHLDLSEATAVVVLACTGMRIADLRRLTWEQVDLDACEIDIAQSKSRAGERIAPLFPPARDALRRLRDQCDEATGPVWLSKLGKIHGRGWRPGVYGLRDELGWKYSPGALRGSVGSILLAGSWVARGWLARPLRMEEVQWWLGHESPTVTAKHYARLSRDHGIRAVALLDERSTESEVPEIAQETSTVENEFDLQQGELNTSAHDVGVSLQARALPSRPRLCPVGRRGRRRCRPHVRRRHRLRRLQAPGREARRA